MSNKGKSLRSDSFESSNQEKIGQEKDTSTAEMIPSTSEKDMVNAKAKPQMVKGRQTQSGPLMPGVVLSHSLSDRGRTFERFIIIHHFPKMFILCHKLLLWHNLQNFKSMTVD